ncbi:MAG TPA: heme ABC transporter permease [Gammaproteobacteria bacterium]|nr:heme ABC transporter permease [Gammaproteobacteria bacterium]
MWQWFHRLASPPHFFRLAGCLQPWLAGVALVLILFGTYAGLVLAPPDYQQGDAFRIIYVHVPSAWLSLMGYTFMAVAAGIGLIWRMKLAHVMAHAAAPVGATFTFLALATGSLWGEPMWGSWWVWDARLTSELILLFLYLGYITLANAFDDHKRGDRASAILALVGVINVPIIHYSVEWWHTLHQPATITKFGAPSITWNMLWPLLVMALGFTLFFAAVVLLRARAEILRREHKAGWVLELKL